MMVSPTFITVDPARGMKRLANGEPKPPELPNGSSQSFAQNPAIPNGVDSVKLNRLIAAMDPQIDRDSFNKAEDELLVFLKEEAGLPWAHIASYFPHRKSWHSLQTKYSQKLNKNRKPRSEIHSPVSVPASENSTLPRRPARRIEHVNYYIPPPDAAASQSHSSVMSEDSIVRQAPVAKPAPEVHATYRSNNLSHSRKSAAQMQASSELFELRRRRDGFAIASKTQRLLRPTSDVGRGMATYATATITKPYLGRQQRDLLDRHELAYTYANHDPMDLPHGALIHADFTAAEVDLLKESVRAVIKGPIQSASIEKLQQIATRAMTSGPFLNRSTASIFHFLKDMAKGEASRIRQIHQISVRRPRLGTDKLLRHRELGQSPRLSRTLCAQQAEEHLAPARVFKSMSSDVNTLAWSPNSRFFAAGSAALTDPASMQYNRSNNLVFGDVQGGRLRELADHIKARVAPSTGVNSLSSMHSSQDPFLYTTISCLEFSKDGKLMFSGAYDSYVNIWRITEPSTRPTCVYRAPTKSPVDALALGPSGTFAAASQTTERSIKLFTYKFDGDSVTECKKGHRLHSPAAISEQNRQFHVEPACIRWAPSGRYGSSLLGGFASKNDSDRRGETCLWDVEAGQDSLRSINNRMVFDLAWCPANAGRFFVGCSPSSNVNRGTRSVVRLHDVRSMGPSGSTLPFIELECPALDINDLVINSSHSDLVSVGCTDGKVYLWDLRQPHKILHLFEHGEPLAELDSTRPREQIDTGVRFQSWNQTNRLLYTGSSDGIVSVWNPYLAEGDAHQYNLVHMDSGIMEAKFSPDNSSLLVGDVRGTLKLLSAGGASNDDNVPESFDFTAASAEELKVSSMRAGVSLEPPPQESNPARSLVDSGQICIRPFGDFPRRQAVQGPNYSGPYDTSSDAERDRQRAAMFQDRAAQVLGQQGADVQPGFAKDTLDAGHWKKRLPQEVRQGFELKTSTEISCFRCRPGVHLMAMQNPEAADADEVPLACHACGNVWLPSVLGYQLVTRGRGPEKVAGSTSEAAGFEPVDTFEEYQDLWEVDRVALQLGRL